MRTREREIEQLRAEEVARIERDLLSAMGVEENFAGFPKSLENQYKYQNSLESTLRATRRQGIDVDSTNVKVRNEPRPPFNTEYLLHLLVRAHEREFLIGDLIEGYGNVFTRFDKRRADIWFYKQVAGSLLPLLRRALLRIGALVWLGRVLRRLIS